MAVAPGKKSKVYKRRAFIYYGLFEKYSFKKIRFNLSLTSSSVAILWLICREFLEKLYEVDSAGS